LTTVSTTFLPDEVWAELDPRQARLTPRARRVLAAVVGVAVAGTVAITLGVMSGELGGSLYVPSWSTRVDTQSHDFVETISITNSSWFDETITGAADRDQHIDVTAMKPARLTIPHGGTRTLTLRFHVTDCAAVAAGTNAPIVHLERFWGTQSVTLDVHGWTADPQDAGFSGPARAACGRNG
jgi:hypothetical protein